MGYKSLVVLPVHNQANLVRRAIPLLEVMCQGESEDSYDLLLIDDASDDDIDEVLAQYKWIKSEKHDEMIGIGGAFQSAYKYARDFDYDVMLMLDPENQDCTGDVAPMMDNLRYGYDIVTCSRILENYDYARCSQGEVDVTAALGEALKQVTEESLTDPLSGIKGVQVKALENMELTEFNHGLFIQLFVQSAYFGLTCLEIPASSGESFASELRMEEDPLGLYLAVLETERHLYKKSPLN